MQTLCCPPGTAPWGAWLDLRRTCIFSISMRCDHPDLDEGEKPPWILFSRQTEVIYRTFFLFLILAPSRKPKPLKPLVISSPGS